MRNFARGNNKEHFYKMNFNLGKWLRGRSLFNISYLQLWWSFYSAEQNGLCYCDTGLLSATLAGFFFHWSCTIYAILVEGIERNISVKKF